MNEDETMRHEWRTPDGFDVRVVITNARLQCTACRKWKPASAFGLRCMRGQAEGQLSLDATERARPVLEVRNQPQCIPCRSNPPKAL